MTRDLKIDFFQINVPSGAEPFGKILQTAFSRPIAKRNKHMGEYYVRLQRLSHAGEIFEGDMVRLRMDILPDKGTLEGDVSPLDLGDNQGIAESCAFIYHVPTSALAFQRNRGGVSAIVMALYFSDMTGMVSPIEINPVLRLDQYEQLASMEVVRKFDFKFAGLKNSSLFRGHGKDMETLLTLIEEFQSPHASISLSMGHSPGGMSARLKKLAETLGLIAKQSDNVVQQAQITGVDEDGETKTVDMVFDAMTEPIPVTTAKRRRLPYQTRREAVAVAFQRRKTDLVKMFTPAP